MLLASLLDDMFLASLLVDMLLVTGGMGFAKFLCTRKNRAPIDPLSAGCIVRKGFCCQVRSFVVCRICFGLGAMASLNTRLTSASGIHGILNRASKKGVYTDYGRFTY